MKQRESQADRRERERAMWIVKRRGETRNKEKEWQKERKYKREREETQMYEKCPCNIRGKK